MFENFLKLKQKSFDSKYQMYLQIVRSLLWNFEVANHVLSYLTAAILQHNLIANLQFQRQGPKY